MDSVLKTLEEYNRTTCLRSISTCTLYLVSHHATRLNVLQPGVMLFWGMLLSPDGSLNLSLTSLLLSLSFSQSIFGDSVFEFVP